MLGLDELNSIPWNGVLSGLATLMAMLLALGNSKLKKILEQTKTNGGSTLKDQLNRVEDSLHNLTLWVEASQHLSQKALFKTDPKGKFLWVNLAFTRMVGMGSEELKDNGWMNTIHSDDFERVRSEWHNSIKEDRKFESFFRIRNTYNKETIQVKATAFPITAKDNTIGFLGNWISLEKVSDTNLD